MQRALPVLAMLAAALAGISCQSLKPTQADLWEEKHLAFRAEPKWKGKSFVNEEVDALLTPETASIRISIPEQRGLLLYNGEHVAVDFPVATGRRAFPTKPGDYNVLAKEPSHHSNLYGKYIDATTKDVLESDVDVTQDPKPEGALFVGSPMPYFLRLTNAGLGMHVGRVPGYPVSHGCIRVPSGIMPRIYRKMPLGAPVSVIAASFGLPEPTPKAKAKAQAVVSARQRDPAKPQPRASL